jgi:signal transduction histidine kinase
MVSEARVPWHQSFRLWEVYFAVVAASVGAAILAGESASPARRLGAVAALVGLALWYLAYGRRLAATDDRTVRGIVFQAGVLLLYAAGIVLVDVFSFVLFALCPLAFMTLSVPRAAVAVVALNALLPIRQLIGGVDPVDVLRGPLPIAVVVAVFSVIVGIWLDGVQRQSDERAELIAQLRASQAEVAQLSHNAGVAAERQRLAGDIHDTIAQGLTSIIMLIQAAEADPNAAGKHLGLALETARDNLAEARALVAALSPTALDGAPLPAALSRLVEHSAVPASFTVDGPARPLATSIDVVLLRAAQESLTNVRKHAAAGTAAVALSYQDGSVTLTVRDDGAGFGADTGDGYGLAAMRNRVEQVSGTLRVDSVPGTGTTVRVEVPTA